MTAQRNPSEVSDVFWLYAQGRTQSSRLPGKWLIFVPAERIDPMWGVIRAATEAGKLGTASKVATARSNQNARNANTRVICVYTYDWTDETDVRRVRAVLRELGFTSKLSYKADEDTRAGKYSNKGNRNISRYYE